jgi:hypothetical protein
MRPVHHAGAAFVGRRSELQTLHAMLERDACRLITLTGVGGSGKSRLVKAALPSIECNFVDSCCWVPLDDVATSAAAASRIELHVGAQYATSCASDAAMDSLATVLRERHALLVLDNAERIPALRRVVEHVLMVAPQVKIIVTSSRRLGAHGEWLLPIAGLAVPPAHCTAQEAAEYDAVRLFALRASIAQPSFDLAACTGTVARIVGALGGIPLAIELAAHWLRLLSIEALEAEVAASLDVLERDGEGDERPEHRGMRVTLESAWQLLAPPEQRALAMLSIFAGSFSRRTAEAVAEASLPILSALADKSLLQSESSGRFCLHPLMRRFGREKARALGLIETIAHRHAEVFLDSLAQADDRSCRHPAAHEDVAAELPDWCSAWRWAIGQHAVDALARTTAPIMHAIVQHGRLIDGVALFSEAVSVLDTDRAEDRRAAAQVWFAIAHLQLGRGQLRHAAETARRALMLARALRLRDTESCSVEVILKSLWQRGLYPEASEQLGAGLSRARRDGDEDAARALLARLGTFEKMEAERTRKRESAGAALQVGASSNNGFLEPVPLPAQ